MASASMVGNARYSLVMGNVESIAEASSQTPRLQAWRPEAVTLVVFRELPMVSR